jgi:hypothetical protein
MASIVDQMTSIYCFVDDELRSHPEWSHWRRSPNDEPVFTDAEVITIGLMQGCFGVATLKQTYRLVAENHARAFPHLCRYQQWVERLHALSAVIGRLIVAPLRGYLPAEADIYLMDSKPIPLCSPIRHGRVRLMRENRAHFGKTHAGWFFGFKLHALVHRSGAILNILLSPGNWPDDKLAEQLCEPATMGIVLGDHAYHREPLWTRLAENNGLILLAPEDGKERRALISSLRERIETVFSGLWNRFADRVFSRSWNGLWNTAKLRVLHSNLCWAGIVPA